MRIARAQLIAWLTGLDRFDQADCVATELPDVVDTDDEGHVAVLDRLAIDPQRLPLPVDPDALG